MANRASAEQLALAARQAATNARATGGRAQRPPNDPMVGKGGYSRPGTATVAPPAPTVAPPATTTSTDTTGTGATPTVFPTPDPTPTGTAPAPVPDPAGQATAIATANAQRDAQAALADTLRQYGLDSLAPLAWTEILNGRSGNEVLQDIRETPQFKARFPSIAARQAAGLPALSPGDIVAYENSATQMMRDAGLPAGFYDNPEDFQQFLNRDVSLKELQSRVDLAKQAASQAPPEVIGALRSQFGVGDGDLTAYYLDPDRAEPLLQKNFAAAQIAGAGTRTGYGTSAAQDLQLAQQGVTAAQAQTGFSALAHDQQLLNPLVGHQDAQISQDQQLGAEFGGNAQDQQAIARRRSDRAADFQDSANFAASQQGQSGIGQATPR